MGGGFDWPGAGPRGILGGVNGLAGWRWRLLAGWLVVASAAGGAPPAAGLNPRSLRDAAAYSASRRGYTLLVVERGRVVFEQYANGSGPRTAHPIFSGTKSFWAVAVLAAADERLLRLDERASATLAEWRGDPRRREITIRELLDFTGGLDPAPRLHSNRVADRNAEALRTPLVAPRGAAFTYGPSHGQVLCEVLRRKLAPRGQSPDAFLRGRVLGPLGIGDVDFRKDRRGNPLLASGFCLTARQWAQFGTLLLERGRHAGRVVVPDRLFGELTRGSRANPAFGLGLWLNRAAAGGHAREPDIENLLEEPWPRQDWRGACLCRSAPPDLFAAVGSGYQRLFVIPSRGLVIVRQGADARFSDAEFLRRILRP